MNRLIIFFILLIVMSGLVLSQSMPPRLGLNAGFSIPLSDFAKRDGSENAGYAKIGFGAGAEFDLFFGKSGFGWSTSFMYIANDYQTDKTLDWIPDFQLQDTGAYTNYSLMTGVKYVHPLGEKFDLFALAQVGMNLANGPFFGGVAGDTEGNLALVEVQMGSQTTQGFSVGCGFIANRTTTVSVRYYSLGSPLFSGNTTYRLGEENLAADYEWEQPISMLMVTVGYTIHFE